MKLRFGIHTGQQETSFADLLALWQRAEELGYDWASVFDHFMPIFSNPEGPCYEGLTALSALAMATRKMQCGIIVTGVTYRNPVLLAKSAVTIDHISQGRLELGLGAAWFDHEHEKYGFEFPKVGVRMDMLEEAMSIVKSLFSSPRTTFEGKHFQVRDAVFEPRPLGKIPLWVGGGGEQRTLKIVARHADGWNYFVTSPEDYRHKLSVLEKHCQEAGRSSSAIRKGLILRCALRDSGPSEVVMEGTHPVFQGTPEELAARLKPFVEMGAGDFLMLARPPVDNLSLELFIQRVKPALEKVAA